MSEVRIAVQKIQQFLETDGSEIEQIAQDLNDGSSGLTPELLVSIIWTFFSVSKSAIHTNENSHNLVCMLAYKLAQLNENIMSLLLVTLDLSDNAKIGVKINSNFRNSYRLYQSKNLNITKYQYLHFNPEGYSALLLTLIKGCAENLIHIIGEYNLDPDSVLLLLLDLISQNNSEINEQFYTILQQFNISRTINMIVRKLDEKYSVAFIHILFHLFNSGIIPLERQIPILAHLDSIIDKLKQALNESTDALCQNLKKPRTLLPGCDTKYSGILLKLFHQYEDSRSLLYDSPHFRIAFSTLDITTILNYAEFDTCSIESISLYVTNYLESEIQQNPDNFLTKEVNLQLLNTLSCHCKSNKLIAQVCSLDNLPACIYTNFLLPSMELSKVPWQLSEIIFEPLSRFSFTQRCEIYKRFAQVSNELNDLKIKNAKVESRVKSILKRAVKNSGNSYEISQLFASSPCIAADKFVQNLQETFPRITPEDVLIDLLKDCSRMGLDFVLWKFTEVFLPFDNSKDRIKLQNDLITWPIYIGSFLGKLSYENHKYFDFKSYLDIILQGLKQNQLSYVCLLSDFLSETANIRYHGKMATDVDIELLSGEGLNQISHLLNINHSELNQKTLVANQIRTILTDTDSNYALNFVSLLDRMQRTLKFIDNLSDVRLAPIHIDDIKSAFFALCDFITFDQYTPIELIEKYSFSYQTAFYITRKSGNIDIENIKQIMKNNRIMMPLSLFKLFWKCELKHIHIPNEQFSLIQKELKKRISEANEETRNELNEALARLNANWANQKRYVKHFDHLFNKLKIAWSDHDLYKKFIQFCLIPRISFSDFDATYCYKFVFRLAHTPNFDLETLIIEIMQLLHIIIFSSTEIESKSFGVFINGLLDMIENREEFDMVHDILAKKVIALLDRSDTDFVIANTINMISKFGINNKKMSFPRRTLHKRSILEKLNKINLEDNSNLKVLVNRVKLMIEQSLNDVSREPSPPPIKDPNTKKTEERVNVDKKDVDRRSNEQRKGYDKQPNRTIINDKRDLGRTSQKESSHRAIPKSYSNTFYSHDQDRRSNDNDRHAHHTDTYRKRQNDYNDYRSKRSDDNYDQRKKRQ